MKKTYMKPSMEIDFYTLGMAIAATCTNQVNAGPGDPALGYAQCSDWGDIFPDEFSIKPFAITDTSFYQSSDTCDCYYTSGGEGYYMS